MKKKGLTLAEVLITLSIIGVVAALTLPTLQSSVYKSKVGPALRKFIATMEVANEHVLTEQDSNNLNIVVSDESKNTKQYLDELGKFVKGATEQTVGFTPKTLQSINIQSYSGTNYSIDEASKYLIFNLEAGDSMGIRVLTRAQQQEFKPTGSIKYNGSYKGIFADVWYDLNGIGTGPNRLGVDIFYFYIDKSGSLIPYGGKLMYNSGYKSNADEWKNGPDRCNATTVNTGKSCAGSVADNNWKVLYKY